MSSTKGIQYRGRFFWAFDVAAGIFLKYLIDQAATSEEANSPWLLKAVSEWRVQAAITECGLTLKEDWSDSQIRSFVALAERACQEIAVRESISAEEIASWQLADGLHIEPRGTSAVLTAPVVELGRAIIALVSGNLPPSPKGEAWFYGTSRGRHTIRMRPGWDGDGGSALALNEVDARWPPNS